MPLPKVHNEWFMPLSPKTKLYCLCGDKTHKGQVYAWGEYVSAKWRTIDYFCQACFESRILDRLIAHSNDCKCTFGLKAKSGYSLPDWIKLPSSNCTNIRDAAISLAC